VTLLNPGAWPDTAWPSRAWPEDSWPEYGTVAAEPETGVGGVSARSVYIVQDFPKPVEEPREELPQAVEREYTLEEYVRLIDDAVRRMEPRQIKAEDLQTLLDPFMDKVEDWPVTADDLRELLSPLLVRVKEQEEDLKEAYDVLRGLLKAMPRRVETDLKAELAKILREVGVV